MNKLLIIGDSSMFSISHSFERGGKPLFKEVLFFDIQKEIDKYVRLGKVGKKINTFLPVEVWQRKGNRALSVYIKQQMPDAIIVIGNAPVFFSTLAFIKSISKIKTFLFWPDTLTNLTTTILDAAKVYDTLLTYSSASIPVFKKLGFEEVLWFPFAGDNEFLGDANLEPQFQYDIAFIGGWRPEREAGLSKIYDAFPNLKFHIRGTDWKRNTTDPRLKSMVSDEAVYGRGFGDLLKQSRININIIDETNYPAANMRFFEIPAVGGLQLCSTCPEQEAIFKEKEHILYFKNDVEMVEQINFVLNNASKAQEIRTNAHKLIQEAHTYTMRLAKLKFSIDA